MKLLFLFLAVIAIIGTAQAYNLDNLSANLGNGAVISIPYNLTYDGSFNVGQDELNLTLNGSTLAWRTATNKTLTSIVLNNVSDVYTFNANGTAGWLNLSARMLNANSNYSLYIDNTLISQANTFNYIITFNYTIPDTNLHSFKVNASLGGIPGINPPAIISNTPINFNPSIDVNNLATFTATSDQSVSWAWTGANEISGDGTITGTATITWTTTGAKTVTATCSNANGSCGTIQWDVTVVSDGSGGGTNYDWLSGTVNVAGATITTNPSVCTTTGGAYSCDYVFVDGQSYWINVSKAGYYSNNTQITFNQDHEIWNPVLTIIPTLSWWNSVTNDDSLIVHTASGATFRMIQSNMISVVWTQDGTTLAEPTGNLTASFNTVGHHNITALGTSTDGLTPMIKWEILKTKAMAGAGDVIAPLDTTSYDAIIGSIGNSSTTTGDFFISLMSPYTNPLGSVFFIFLYVLPLVVIWIRQEKALIPVGLLVIFGVVLSSSLPASWIIPAQIILIVTTVGILKSLLKERG